MSKKVVSEEQEVTTPTLSPQDIAAIVATAVAEAVKQTTNQTAEVLEKVVERSKPDADTFYPSAEYLARPENQDPARELAIKVTQHGRQINLWGLRNTDTVKHLNNIIDFTQKWLGAGRLLPLSYFNGRVTVTLKGHGDDQKLDIDYPFGHQHTAVNKDYFSSFSDLVQKIDAANQTRTIK